MTGPNAQLALVIVAHDRNQKEVLCGWKHRFSDSGRHFPVLLVWGCGKIPVSHFRLASPHQWHSMPDTFQSERHGTSKDKNGMVDQTVTEKPLVFCRD